MLVLCACVSVINQHICAVCTEKLCQGNFKIIVSFIQSNDISYTSKNTLTLVTVTNYLQD